MMPVIKNGEPVQRQFLSESEQRFILSHPLAIRFLMTYHDVQQSEADAMGLECYGNAKRYEELKHMAQKIVAEDPELWDDDTRKEFDPNYVPPTRSYK